MTAYCCALAAGPLRAAKAGANADAEVQAVEAQFQRKRAALQQTFEPDLFSAQRKARDAVDTYKALAGSVNETVRELAQNLRQ